MTRIPEGVLACGPDGRIADLPAEDVAVLQEFAAYLTEPRSAEWCQACHRVVVQPHQHQCSKEQS